MNTPKTIWHHPVFQYLRRTVNPGGKSPRNPLCQYCKSHQRDYLKNTDNQKNREMKRQALDQFWQGFKQSGMAGKDIVGLKVLYAEDDELNALA